mgnify:CR=1 FL=1
MKTEWRYAVYRTEPEKPWGDIPLPTTWVVIPCDYPWYAVLCDTTTNKPIDVYDLPEVEE